MKNRDMDFFYDYILCQWIPLNVAIESLRLRQLTNENTPKNKRRKENSDQQWGSFLAQEKKISHVSWGYYLQVCAEVPKPDLLASSSPPFPPGSLLKWQTHRLLTYNFNIPSLYYHTMQSENHGCVAVWSQTYRLCRSSWWEARSPVQNTRLQFHYLL